MTTLAAHGEDLFGSEGAKATVRAELRLDLMLNKDAWKTLSGQERDDWVSHLVINVSQQRRLSNPRIISWNASPDGYRNIRDKIWSLFAQGQPLICLQDIRIPLKLIPTIKDELHAQFPQYWIFISAVNKQGVTCDSSGEHYNFTTLTALNSYHFPSATSETLHPGRKLVSTQQVSEEHWPCQLRPRVVANLLLSTCTNLRLLTRQNRKRFGIPCGVGAQASQRQNNPNHRLEQCPTR